MFPNALNNYVTFNTNKATNGDGGGMYLADGSTTNFNNVIVSGNTAPLGKVKGVAYEPDATLKPDPLGNKLTDKDDPDGKPVQV